MSSKEEVENQVSEFVSPLKVDKLKAELKRRGVDTTGKKADLVKRLQDIMVDERLQGMEVPLEPENGNPEDPEGDLPDDSVHSTTEQQECDTKATEGPDVIFEVAQQESTSEQTMLDYSETGPPILEMDMSKEPDNFENSEAPPDSTEKMEDEEHSEPKPKLEPDPDEELPPLDADTVDEDDADQVLELESDPYTPPEDDKLIVLDCVNCELNFQISQQGLTAQNRQDGPLQLLWAGGRANFGVREGKFGFECKILKSLPTSANFEEVPAPGVRIGWSTDRCPFLLGSSPNSYAYDSEGSIVRDRNHTSYGKSFSEGDVISAMINIESDPPETSFALNGVDLGSAHQIPKATRDAFFPHVAARQFQIEVNFGATPFQYELPEGYLPLTSGTEDKLIKPGTRSGEEKELLFIIGLPGCGKTRWVEKYMMNNEGKRFTHVCDESVQPLFFPDVVRKRTYEGDPVMTTKPLPFKAKLLDGFCRLAATKDRHFIIDARSTFKATQARRMKPFDNHKRIAVIVHPFDNFLSFRQRQVADFIPRSSVMHQIKLAFHIPEEGELFSEVRFPELVKEKVIKSLQGDPQWAPRKDIRRRDRFPRMGRGGRRDYRDPRDHRDYRPQQSSGYRQGGYGGYYSGHGGHGYNRGGYSPYPMYPGNYGHGGQGGYGYGQGGGYNSYRGYYDRRPSGGNRGNKRPRK